MLVRCRLILLFLLLTYTGAYAQSQLQQRIDSWISQEEVADAFWGILVSDLGTGEVLYAEHPGKRFIPASNNKLYTTAAALHLLGPGFRYATDLLMRGQVRDSTLFGDLIVRGAGDPSFGANFEELGRKVPHDPTAVFREWVQALKARGITRVRGHLIGDDNVFDDVPLGNDWAWDDFPYGYAAEISGLTLNENVVALTVTAGSQAGVPATITWEPMNTHYLTVLNATITLPAGTRGETDYTRYLGTNVVRTTTALPVGRRDEQVLTVHNPTAFFVTVLREVLRQEGIIVLGESLDVDELEQPLNYAATGLERVARHLSLPLTEIVRETNKESNNLFAEMLMRTVGVYAGPGWNEDRDAFSAGVQAAKPFFALTGMDTTTLGLQDGSGLSRRNLVTPEMTLALLHYMHRHPDPAVRQAFFDSLPIGGEDGTLGNRFGPNEAGRGRVFAKTGTLSHASSLAGYVHARSGRRYAFVVMANHYTGPSAAARRVQDQIVNLLAGM